MNFYEFLLANDEKMLIDYIVTNSKEKISNDFENKLLSYLNNYYIVGGMPEVVEEWIRTKDVTKIEVIQSRILDSYELDFAKHAPLSDLPKINYIWEYIPRSLAKENAKFVYGHAKPGARAKDLEDSLRWLIDAGLCYRINRIEKHAIPLSSYVDLKSFKVYMCDVGLLRFKAKLDASAIISNDENLYKEFKGAMAENFVLLELLSINENIPYYWTSR